MPPRRPDPRGPDSVAAVLSALDAGARGTPPNVVETDPLTWIRLASGRLDWAGAVRSGAVHASGPRADLAAYLPVI